MIFCTRSKAEFDVGFVDGVAVGEGQDLPECGGYDWVPAFAGMTAYAVTFAGMTR